MKIRARVITKLPASLKAAGGLKVSKKNGDWTFEPGWEQLAYEPTLPDLDNRHLWAMNPTNGVYTRINAGTISNAVSASCVRHDAEQSLSDSQKEQARENIGAAASDLTVLSYPTVAALALAAVPADVAAVQTLGYYASGDGGGCLRVRVGSPGVGRVPSADGAYWEVAETEISVDTLGAKGDGVTDDTAAFVATAQACQTLGRVMRLGPHTYTVTSVPLGPQGLTVRGSGRDVSVIQHEPGTNASPNDLFVRTDAPLGFAPFSTTYGDLCFEDFTIRGRLDDPPEVNTGGVSARLYYYRSITHRRIRWEKVHFVANVIRYAEQVIFDDCDADASGRDVYRAVDCYSMIVHNCRAYGTGDDCISYHTGTNWAPGQGFPIREGLIVTGCALRDSRGISVCGARQIIIANNVMNRMHAYAVRIDEFFGLEGSNTCRQVQITDNIILDTKQANQAVIQIQMAQARGAAASSNTIPGYVSLGGTPIYPWDFDDLNSDTPENPVAPLTDIKIEGNTVARTLPAVGAYSDWGYGPWYDAGEPRDGEVTDANLIPANIVRFHGYGCARRISIKNNNFADCQRAINFAEPMGDMGYEQVDVSGNIAFNCQLGFVLVNGATAYNAPQFVIENNKINLDPYRHYSNSNADGTYAALGQPDAIRLQAIQGVIIKNNHFMNCGRMVQANAIDTIVMEGNVGYCNPVALGYNAGNRGIGEILYQAQGFKYVVIDADPTSATYLDYVNTMVDSATAQPSAGVYIAGWFVKNRAPAVSSGRMLLGWIRLTTGSGHVVNTDWRAFYVSTAAAEGTMAHQNANAVAITGGSIAGLSSLSMVDEAAKRSACAALGTWYMAPRTAALASRNSNNDASDATYTAQKTITIPGGSIGPNGLIRIACPLWQVPSSGASKNLRIYLGGLGGTVVYGVALTTVQMSQPFVLIRNFNAENAQRFAQSNFAGIGTSTAAPGTAAIDTSVDFDVVFAVAWGAATAGETITLIDGFVETLYGA